MPKYPLQAILLLVPLSASACVDMVASDMQHVEREEKRFTTSSKPQVSLSTWDGAIEIRPWDRSEVLVVVEKRAVDKDAIATIAVQAQQDGDRVTVDVTERRKDHSSFFLGFSGRSAKLIVSLPASAEVTARSGDGSIDVEGLAGKLDLRSGDGSIRGRSLAGDVKARTGDGSIVLDGVTGPLDVDTGDGSVHVSGKLTAVRARSGDGSMRIHADEGSTASGDWDITTGDGSVTLEIPDGFSGELDAHTGDGRVRLEGMSVNETTADSDRHSRRRNSLRGRLGSGGKAIRVRTGDGSIMLRRS